MHFIQFILQCIIYTFYQLTNFYVIVVLFNKSGMMSQQIKKLILMYLSRCDKAKIIIKYINNKFLMIKIINLVCH